jgi:hypothetical protein
MLENAVDSPASSARFVGLRAVTRDSLAVKDLLAKGLTKLLHELISFAMTKTQSNEKCFAYF